MNPTGQENRMPPAPKTIRERLAEAKQRTIREQISGHDIMGLERFEEDTRHMAIIEVLSDASPVGSKGEKIRLFVTDDGYRKMQEGQKKGAVRIRNHAAVRDGNLYYDHKDRGR